MRSRAEYYPFVIPAFQDFLERVQESVYPPCPSVECPFFEHECNGEKRCLINDIIALLNIGHDNENLVKVQREKIERLERERDAAVEDVKELCTNPYSACHYCKSSNKEYVSNDCMDCANACNWQWRGAKGK